MLLHAREGDGMARFTKGLSGQTDNRPIPVRAAELLESKPRRTSPPFSDTKPPGGDRAEDIRPSQWKLGESGLQRRSSTELLEAYPWFYSEPGVGRRILARIGRWLMWAIVALGIAFAVVVVILVLIAYAKGKL